MTISTAADPLGRTGRRPARPPAPGLPAAGTQPGSDLARALTGVVEDLAGQFELRPLLERILWHAADLLGCRSGSICTVDEQAGCYRKEVDLGVACRSGAQFPLTEGVTGEIVRAGGPVTFTEYTDVRGGHIDPADRADLHATIGVPIRWAGAVIGSCIVFSDDPRRQFGAQDVTLLELFAGHAGLAIVNARMHAQAADLARAEATGLERDRIVRDVHDSVARALATVVLHLGNAEPAGAEPPDDSADEGPQLRRRNQLELARAAARTALVETRRIVLGVRPSAPQTPTIQEAIESQVVWARGTGLDVRLVVAGPAQPLPPEVTDELFGLAQQAISAIVAHADARTARVGLVYGATEVALLIQDDGVGFDLDDIPRPDGSRPPARHQINESPTGQNISAARCTSSRSPAGAPQSVAAIPYRPVTAEPPARCTVLLVEHRPLVRAGLLALLADRAAALTAREREVRDLVSRGLPDRQIAERLHISVKTVEKHVGSALRKTGAHNRTELDGMTVRLDHFATNVDNGR